MANDLSEKNKTTPARTEDIVALLHSKGLIGGSGWQAERLAGDGSNRQFYRIRKNGRDSFLAVLPPHAPGIPATPYPGLAEAEAAYHIGRHLHSYGIPVPEIIAFESRSGIILFEDLGDTLLHDKILARDHLAPDIKRYYEEAVGMLVRMQVLAGKGFDPNWCWDSPHYDRQLMLEKESAYFLDTFCRNYLGIKEFPSGLTVEFESLAARAGRQPSVFFLHRDFQSRNLMIHKGKIAVIDFQGARLGPLGYDLASLLIDPYASLSGEHQKELLELYLDILAKYIPLDRCEFAKGYAYLAIQRNLQILGAFAFLYRQRAKPFFGNYIGPALITLARQLAEPTGKDYPCLKGLVKRCLNLLEKSEIDKQP